VSRFSIHASVLLCNLESIGSKPRDSAGEIQYVSDSTYMPSAYLSRTGCGALSSLMSNRHTRTGLGVNRSPEGLGTLAATIRVAELELENAVIPRQSQLVEVVGGAPSKPATAEDLITSCIFTYYAFVLYSWSPCYRKGNLGLGLDLRQREFCWSSPTTLTSTRSRSVARNNGMIAESDATRTPENPSPTCQGTQQHFVALSNHVGRY